MSVGDMVTIRALVLHQIWAGFVARGRFWAVRVEAKRLEMVSVLKIMPLLNEKTSDL
jgi:hypothetical protein